MNEIKNANLFHVWSVLCQDATIDKETNDLSLLKTIDGLTIGFDNVDKLQQFTKEVAEKPAAIPVQAELVSLWKKIDHQQPAEIEVRVTYRDPEGTELQTMEFPLKLEDGTFRHRNRLNIPALAVTMPGEYRFVIEAKGVGEKTYTLVAELPIDINLSLATK